MNFCHNPSPPDWYENIRWGGGTTVHGKGDINKIVGIIGVDETPPVTHPEPKQRLWRRRTKNPKRYRDIGVLGAFAEEAQKIAV